MLANSYIPIINADNFDIALIYEVQPSKVTSLEFIKTLNIRDFKIFDNGTAINKILELSKHFTFWNIETLSISKAINFTNKIQSDFLYCLINDLIIDNLNFVFDYQMDLLLSQILDDCYTISYISIKLPIKLFAITGKKIAMDIEGKRISMEIESKKMNMDIVANKFE